MRACIRPKEVKTNGTNSQPAARAASLCTASFSRTRSSRLTWGYLRILTPYSDLCMSALARVTASGILTSVATRWGMPLLLVTT
jgi:hypothetical protein